ncbi:hypothetical protein H5410_060815 [Solanum commersonii]|uniref:Uncharacterized protein n=1 Tax=Solanum commersonii TaxID=4109 RepID=A0A9J5W6G8_SOLCO|nr:hypothetical protein H5410_060815 [Solanum commersonii]
MVGSKRSRKGETLSPLVVGNQCKNLAKRLCKGMVGHGSNVKGKLSIWATNMNNLRWRFCYGGLILKAEGIEEEAVDMTVAYHPDLTGKIVDVTRTKALDMSHGFFLST